MEPKLPSGVFLKLDPCLTFFSVPFHGFLLWVLPDKPLSGKSLALDLFLGNLTQGTPTFLFGPLLSPFDVDDPACELFLEQEALLNSPQLDLNSTEQEWYLLYPQL